MLKKWEIEGQDVKCKICGNDKENQAYDVREMMFSHGDVFRYFQCAKCDCLQIETIPSDLSRYYADDYYSYQEGSGGLRNFLEKVRDRHSFSKRGIVGRLLNVMFPNKAMESLRLLSINSKTSILDVGCGAGSLLCVLREFGMENLLGIDPYIDADLRYENGVEILRKQITDIEGRFDVMMFHHSFEHFQDPAEALGAVSRLLKPGGHCLIRIPIIPSYAWEHYGVNWVQLDAPRHICIHSIKSMEILARQAGLEVGNVVYDSTAFQLWGSQQYAEGIPLQDSRSFFVNPMKSTFSIWQIAAFARRAAALNRAGQGDQAAFHITREK